MFNLIKLICLLLGVGAVFWALGKNLYQNSFKKQVEKLFDFSTQIEPKIFTYKDLGELPEPVQKYFKKVLEEGQPYIHTARLKHSGKFKTGIGKPWTSIQGEQYFTLNPPGFLWQGKTQFFSARDMYMNREGRLIVHLLSLVPIVNVKGPSVDQGELLRWLAECIWFPTSLLPRPGLQWEALSDLSAKLHITHHNQSVSCTVFFNERFEICRLETHRFMDPENKELWEGVLLDYEKINGVRIPTRIQATWKLKEGDFTYADFIVDKLDYDIPQSF